MQLNAGVGYYAMQQSHLRNYHSIIQLTDTKQTTKYYHGKGPNKGRALRAAAVRALNALGISLSQENADPYMQSWVTDTENNQTTLPVPFPHKKKLLQHFII